MAYVAHDWECGEVVTAELLNAIENALQDVSEQLEGLDERVTALEGNNESAEVTEGGE